MNEEDYWNKSEHKAFSFDDGVGVTEVTENVRKLFVDDNVSEISYELPTNDIPLNLLISEKDLQIVLQEQSMEETQLPKKITVDEELKLLRRQLQERINPPPASVVITKLISKKPYFIECFKSLEEKESLLDEAINSGNGDAILCVMLFLVKTLKKKHIIKLLQTRQIAANHYINYLILRRQIIECAEWLSLLGNFNKLAMMQFYIAMQTTNPESKRQKLTTLQKDFVKYGINTYYSQILLNYSNLLEFQHNERTVNSKAYDLMDTSPLETLYYTCSMYKWHENAPTSRYSPNKLAESFKISQSQFEWIALNERSRSQAWRDLEVLFEKKSWHNLKAKVFSINIPLDKAILQLYRLEAPAAILNYFLAKVNDPHHRLALSQKIGATKSIVDSLVELREKQDLEKFIETIAIGTDVRFYAENALKNLKSKWKADNLKLLKG